MISRIPALQRFIYSHYFFGGLRQALGVLLPALVCGWLFGAYDMGMVASIGAACVAVIDQPGSPRRYSTNNMLGAVLLGTLTVAITGFVSTHDILFWIVIPALCFMFSMLTVYGKQGGLMGFACLLIMTLTMRTPLAPDALLMYTLYSFLGGCFYFLYSIAVHRIFWHREEQQGLSVALFATADYIDARAQFYDVNSDLDECYRTLIQSQADMTEKQQAARNTVLRELPKGTGRADRHRLSSLNIFIDMVALLNTMIATQTDYSTLRRILPESDALIFCRDALIKMANSLRQMALSVARNQPSRDRSSTKAELRAIEFELMQFRQEGFAQSHPEVYALLVQVLRRLRNAARILERMAEHTRDGADVALVDSRLENTLNRFISRSELRFGMITSNLRLDSPHFRYAIRVSVAALLALLVAHALSYGIAVEGLATTLHLHGYWIILTIIIIMKPGFALTRQRNRLRLAGTFLGCALALVLFMLNPGVNVYFAVLVAACVLGYSMIQVNFMAAAVFNTLTVLLVFHFLAPTTPLVAGERLVDTVIGCALALICSYILPWWEYNFMGSLAKALRNANLKYFKAGRRYADLARTLRASEEAGQTTEQITADYHDADVSWRIARKNVHIAFGNYASAFYRMASEPARRQKNVPELNHLLLQHHNLTSQIAAAIPLLAALPTIPPGIAGSLEAVQDLLEDRDANPPLSIETEDELAALAYPIRQMVKAAQSIRQEMRGLDEPLPAPRIGRIREAGA